jgi:hypothetical protein
MDKKNIAIGAAAIVLLAFVIWWGIKNFNPSDPPKTKTQLDTDAYLKELAKKSGGDFSKLSPEEQQKVNSMTSGRGAMMISRMPRN